MRNPFKKREIIDHIEVFTGKVKFIFGSEIKSGTVFGKPYNAEKILFNPGGLTYHIVDDAGKVYEVKAHAIERDKS